MLSPVSLMNMEMQLYGGCGSRSLTAPSFINGYKGNIDNSFYQYNPTFNGYYNNNVSFGQQIPQGYAINNPLQNNSQPSANQDTTSFGKLTDKQKNGLINAYADGLEYKESLGSAIVSGGVMGAIMMNPRMIAHPINYFTTSFGKDSVVKEMFKDVKKPGSDLNALWNKDSAIMEEAFSQMHRAEARSKGKLGLFRASYKPEEFNHLKGLMEEALKTNEIEKVAEATEKLRYAYCRNGKIFQFKNWIKNGFKNGKKGLPTVMSMLESGKEEIAKNTNNLLEYGSKNITFKSAFKKAGGWLALAFGAMEILTNMGKITSAKQRDKENAEKGVKTNYGSKQIKQTAFKATVNTLGWAAGETAGIWAYSKWGAKLGSKFHPLVGTAVGAVIGLVCGSVSMNIANKAARKLVGEDVANRIDAENLARTEDGQAQLIEDAANKLKDGENIDMYAADAIRTLLNQEMQKQQAMMASMPAMNPTVPTMPIMYA